MLEIQRKAGTQSGWKVQCVFKTKRKEQLKAVVYADTADCHLRPRLREVYKVSGRTEGLTA